MRDWKKNFILENSNLYQFYVCYKKFYYFYKKNLLGNSYLLNTSIRYYNGKPYYISFYKLRDFDFTFQILTGNVPFAERRDIDIDIDIAYYYVDINYLPYISFIQYAKKYPRLWHLCEQLYSSHNAKCNRVKDKIESILYDEFGNLRDCLFVSLNFKDSVLASTSQETRRKYVRRFLKSQYDNYVANIDFGAMNGREHYHSVFGGSFVNPHAWPYGNVDFEHIRKTPEKIAYYINKLTYHSVKDTTGYVIYSR